ncbi:unnamed protein product [Urochloa humidicola]
MAAAAGLSGLPDNVLYRVLYFAPAKEAASTAVLSRSYDRSYNRRPPHVFDDISGKIEAFSRDMAAALFTAAGEPIRRLTLHVDECCYQNHFFRAYRADGGPGHDMIAALLASPAARAAEELAVVIAPRPGYSEDDDRHKNWSELSFGSIPSETLRALHATNVGSLVSPPRSRAWPSSGCGGAACPSLTSSASSTPLLSSPCCTSSATLSAKEHTVTLRRRRLSSQRRYTAAGWFARR